MPPDAPEKEETKRALDAERRELLERIEDALETPMVLLGLAWLALLVVELIWGLTPLLETITTVIWGIFVLDFLLKFVLAPRKGVYLKQNVVAAVSLLFPALRLLRAARLARVLQAARAARGLRLVRVVASLNRGMRTLGATMARRGFRYVVLLTLLMALVGAAGMYAFEKGTGSGFDDFGSALWWTAMLMTTLGSENWPRTPEGRALCFLLSLYAFAVFGYVTAVLATYFIGRDAEEGAAPAADTEALRREIAGLRDEVRRLAERPAP